MNTNPQSEIVSTSWLYSKGWTIRAAARRIKKDAGHVARVVHGTRKSAVITNALIALPPRDLVLREKIAR